MPTVNCKVNNYVYVKEGEHIVFFNDIFEDKTYLILLASLIELLCPDTSSFDIPVSIEVKVDENSVINLSENLEVTGSKEYRYFILKSHYEKWKKTSFISNCILITISFITALFFLYLFFKSNKNYIMGICFFIVLSIKFWASKSRLVYILRPPVFKKDEGISLMLLSSFKTAS